MKKNSKKVLSILTAIVLWNATNTHVINSKVVRPLEKEKYLLEDNSYDFGLRPAQNNKLRKKL